ncbi:hypothetical protein, partial [Saccharibacillus sacchari]|uniref:hypothetical protein n=1 Tax=Saccharibacillus sacchari TaxID=456493 RepID=UPI001B801198
SRRLKESTMCSFKTLAILDCSRIYILTMIFIIATHLLFSFQGANRVHLFLSFGAVYLSGDFYILSQFQAVRQALF